MFETRPAISTYFDSDGTPLEDGYVYFGTLNLNPETNPVTVYWDSAGTQPAVQPLRTSGGYIYRNGAPAKVYCSAMCSITVRDKNERLIYSTTEVPLFVDVASVDAIVGPVVDAAIAAATPAIVAEATAAATAAAIAAIPAAVASAISDAVGVTVGYPNIPQNPKSADYTCIASDSGKHIYHPTTDNNARTFTIPANASVGYSIGTVLTFVNDKNTVTVAINSDTLVWAQDGTTGSRTLAVNGVATAIKVTSTRWYISGTGLT